MATLSDPPQQSFHISQLIYDTRYRSTTIQVIAFILVMLGIVWLGNNVVTNLSRLGKDFDFSFLGNRAGYDINQMLVSYSNDSTHARAALVGILNTLLVAFLGCITATIIGVTAGVLRLSKNWIVGRLMTVYVEGFRNIPLLLWIIVIFAVMTESTPAPRAFRGDDPDSTMILWDSVAVTNRGIYIPALDFGVGAWGVIAVFFASIIGIIAYRRYASKKQEATGQQSPVFLVSLGLFFVPAICAWLLFNVVNASDRVLFVDQGALAGSGIVNDNDLSVWENGGTICAAPDVLDRVDVHISRERLPFDVANATEADHESGECLLYAGTAAQLEGVIPVPLDESTLYSDSIGAPPIGLSAPYLQGFNFTDGTHLRNSLIALWIALSLYTGAFIAEIVRAGILAVNKGQTEASSALGMRASWTMNLVVLPQALRVIIPPLISQYLNLTKNSSLAIAVGYMDVRATLGGITINQTGRELEGMLLLGLFYLITSLIISGGMNIYNNSVKLQER